MKGKFTKKLSFILVLAMVMQLMSFAGTITVSAATQNTYTLTVVENAEDYFAAAKLKGAYIEAGSVANGHEGAHITLLKGDVTSGYVSKLVKATDTETATAMGWTEELLAKVSATSYVTKDKDGAWMYRAQLEKGNWIDEDDITADTDIKDLAFYTQGNYRIRSGAAQGVGGAMYFKLDDTFTTSDSNLTFVVEYLDIGGGKLGFSHPNNTSVKGAMGYNNYELVRGNSGLWKTVVFSTTEAMIKTGYSGLGSNAEDIKINANSGATYIKRLGVIRTADLNLPSASAFDVSNVVYKNDKNENIHYLNGGKIITSADVTNNGEATTNATLYTAVYDSNDAMVSVAKSAQTDIEAGKTVTLTTDGAVNMPDGVNYTFRKFVWTSDLNPAYSIDEADKLVLNATAYDRRVLLKWSEYTSEIPLEDTIFYIYRDGVLVGASKTAAYYDDQATEGTHTWQINAVKESTGEIVYRSNYAVATAVNNLSNGGAYVKARFDSKNGFRALNGAHADIENGLHMHRIANIYTLDEIQSYYSHVTDETPAEGTLTGDAASAATSANQGQIAYAKAAGIKYITNSSDGSTRTIRVTDGSGVTKDVWHSGKLLRCSNALEYNPRPPYMYVDVLSSSGITSDDSDVAIFVELLAKGRTSLRIQYMGFTEAADGTKTASVKTTPAAGFAETGNWQVVQFNLTDAYFGLDKTSFDKNTDFRIMTDGADTYVSSVYITKATGSDAVYEYTTLRDRDFGAVNEDVSGKLYPDGVSIDFSTGTAVENGISLYASADGTGSNRADVSENGYAEMCMWNQTELPSRHIFISL